MFGRNKSPSDPIESCARSLFQTLLKRLERQGRVRAEDLITIAASITGELCIAAAGQLDPRKHDFAPGSRILSDKVNNLLCGDVADIEAVPADSIVGAVIDRLLTAGYEKSDFPDLKTIFEQFAASVGKPSDWGKVPLGVPGANYPSVLPLRVAYESRPIVDQTFQPLAAAQDRLKAAVLTLAEALIAVREVIDRKTAVLLALQVVNGMSKTAPMTDAAMQAVMKRLTARQ